MKEFSNSADAELLRLAISHYEKNEMQAAMKYFLDLARGDCEESFLYLSLMYKTGDGVDKDEIKAASCKKKYVEIIEKKSSAGQIFYMRKFAYILQYGDGISIDNSRALSLFFELAEAGDGEAQFHLSRLYGIGSCGLVKNSDKERYWLNRAVASNWPIAIYYYALLMEGERNSDESLLEVRALMQKAASLGCWQAKDYLE